MSNNASNLARPPDIVLLTPTLDGGVGLVTSRLAQGMRERGITVEVWSLTSGPYAAKTATIATTRYLGVTRASSALFPLIKLLRVHRPKTLLSASYHMNCIAVLARMLSQHHMRLVVAEHTSLTNGFETISFLKRAVAKLCIRIFYKYADAWVAVSNDASKQMAHFAHLPESAVTTIYNPVITDEMFEKSEQIVHHPFFSSSEPVLLAVGRLSSEKDYPTLLRALAVINQTKSVNLLIVGEGPERSALEKLTKQLGLADRVSLVGHISNPYPFFKKADVLVLSSKREGLPTVLIEGLALGIKIVSTDARSGPREILENGRYGQLVPVSDSKKLAKAILETLNSPKPIVPTGVLETYKINKAVSAYLDVLQLTN